MQAWSVLLLAGLILFNSACSKPTDKGYIQPNFHPGIPIPVPPEETEPPFSVGTVDGMKVGPGAVSSRGSAVSAQAKVTLDNKSASGTQVSGRFSISKFQVR